MGCIDRSKVNTPSGFPGRKAMSASRMPSNQGSMKTSHGVVPATKTSGLVHSAGRVGAGKAGFSSGAYKQGPCPISKKK